MNANNYLLATNVESLVKDHGVGQSKIIDDTCTFISKLSCRAW